MIGTPVVDKLYAADDRMGLTIKKGNENIKPEDYVKVVSKELEKRMTKLPENIYTKPKTRTHDGVKATQQFLSATGEREKAFVIKDGKAYQNRGGELVPVASKD